MINRKQRIESKLTAELNPYHLEVVNESHRHHVPEGSETHFKLVIVSDDFAQQSRILRHRKIHHLLEDELAQGLHALSLHLYTIEEWQKIKVPNSPACRDGFDK